MMASDKHACTSVDDFSRSGLRGSSTIQPSDLSYERRIEILAQFFLGEGGAVNESELVRLEKGGISNDNNQK